MAVFQYKALQADGKTSEGQLEAANRQEAFQQIASRGLTLLRLAEAAGKQDAAKKSAQPMSLPWKSTRVPYALLEDFTRSLASLLAAGVPLSKALTILFRETTHPVASAKWKEIHDLVIDGISLADAMSRSPDVFPTVYVAMVEAGETGGFLDVVLTQIADFQSRDRELRARVVAAMIYPCVLLFLAVGVLIFLMVFFIPRFQTLFEGFDAALPLLTQVIIAVSNIVRVHGLIVAGVVFGAVMLFRNWLKTEKGRRGWEALVLKLPVVGPLVARTAMTRFCRMLGTLLTAGVPLMNGLGVARRSLGNQTLIDAVAESSERVKKGEQLAASLANCRALFGGSTLEMISVAEESGRLDKELIRISEVTEQALDRQLKMAVSLAEPVMLFFIAGFIGTIFIGMVIPIFTIQDSIK